MLLLLLLLLLLLVMVVVVVVMFAARYVWRRPKARVDALQLRPARDGDSPRKIVEIVIHTHKRTYRRYGRTGTPYVVLASHHDFDIAGTRIDTFRRLSIEVLL